jgi:hypothetical protein
VAGIAGFIALALFMIFWYRLPGVVAVVSLLSTVLMLALFKLVPVVLTAAGMAGFILSVGLGGRRQHPYCRAHEGRAGEGKAKPSGHSRPALTRAWSAIRDSNIAHIIAAVILFWFGTSLIKGFALVFGLASWLFRCSRLSLSRARSSWRSALMPRSGGPLPDALGAHQIICLIKKNLKYIFILPGTVFSSGAPRYSLLGAQAWYRLGKGGSLLQVTYTNAPARQ